MTTDTADTITAYRDGRFTTGPRPAWWEAEDARVFGDPNAQVETTFGNERSNEVQVWAPTDADLLTLLTGPAKTFTTLREGASIEDSLDDIRNALGYFRHGPGEHIDRLGGENQIDRDRDVQRWRRARVVEQTSRTPPPAA